MKPLNFFSFSFPGCHGLVSVLVRAVSPNCVTSDLAKRTHFPIGFFVKLLEPVALGAVLSCAMRTKAFLFDVVSSLKTTVVAVLVVIEA